jgi:hypothetical protein
MVVRLKADQFTAGDMNFMVRSRRNARADSRLYGANANEVKRVIKGGTEQNPTTRLVSEETYNKINETPNERFNRLVKERIESTKHENEEKYLRQSVNYAANKILEATPLTVTVSDKGEVFKESDNYFNPPQQEQQAPSLEEQVREEPLDNLHTKARQMLNEIEDDIKQMDKVKLEKKSLKRTPKKKQELDFNIQKSISLDI